MALMVGGVASTQAAALSSSALPLPSAPQAPLAPPIAAPPSLTLAQAMSGAITRPNLDVGDVRSEVAELQAVLQLLGFYGGPVDGVYGASTRSAVAIFQQIAGLEATGQVTPSTWNLLFPPDPSAVSAAPPVTPTPSPAVGSSPSASQFPVPPGSGQPSTPVPPPEPTPAPPPAATAPTPEPTRSAPDSETDPVSLPILKNGDRGSAVEQLQRQLQGLGFDTGGSDGVFGDQTEAAVQEFQAEQGLEADGVVGPATWDALLRPGR